MRVYNVEGEPTRYHVESTSLQCLGCNKTFGRHDPRFKYLAVGDKCPVCSVKMIEQWGDDEKAPALDVRFHLVDLAEFRPIGRCTCEHFAFRLQAQLSKLSPANLRSMTQGEANKLRCTHIMAARELALDTTVEAHERHRHEKAGRQREGAGA
jgi:hypothetical protein